MTSVKEVEIMSRNRHLSVDKDGLSAWGKQHNLHVVVKQQAVQARSVSLAAK